MKKIIVALLLFSCTISHSQKGISFVDKDFDQTLQLAKKSDKITLYVFYGTWCPHCEKMKKYVFTEPEVGDFFNKNFITNLQDAESFDGMKLAKKFTVKSYPTFIFLDDNGAVLYRTSGEFTAENLILEGKTAMDKTKQFPTLKSNFEKDVTNADAALAYISVLRRAGLDASLPAYQYFEKVKRENLVSGMNWKIFANGVGDMDTELFQYVVQNQDAFAKVSSEKRVSRKLVNAAQERLQEYVGTADTTNYNMKRKTVANLKLQATDSLLSIMDRQIAERASDWKKYHKVSATSIKFAWNDARLLTEIVRNDIKNLTDKAMLKEDIAWIERAIELQPDQERYMALARIQQKIGDKKAALESAQKARNIAASFNFQTGEIDTFIKEIK